MKNKKNIAAWVFVVSAVFVCIIMMPEASAQIHANPLSLGDLAPRLQSPEDIARYMWRNFAFENDQKNFGKEEYWQTPEEFLSNRKGDCEDFARFAVKMLKLNGKKAFLLNVYGGKFAHTVAVFRDGGKYSVIDRDEVKRYEADSLEALMTEIYPHWHTGAIVTASKNSASGRILKQFERQAKAKQRLAISL